MVVEITVPISERVSYFAFVYPMPGNVFPPAAVTGGTLQVSRDIGQDRHVHGPRDPRLEVPHHRRSRRGLIRRREACADERVRLRIRLLRGAGAGIEATTT